MINDYSDACDYEEYDWYKENDVKQWWWFFLDFMKYLRKENLVRKKEDEDEETKENTKKNKRAESQHSRVYSLGSQPNGLKQKWTSDVEAL